jgi:glucose uptake protein GlcU
MKIGFPLTQTCVLFAAAWGVLYFKEFALTLRGYLIRFVLGISAIIVGAYLLGDSG